LAARLTYREIIASKTRFAPIPLWLNARQEVSQLEKRVYGLLLCHLGNRGYAFPSQVTMACELGTNVRSIKRAVQGLEYLGLIEVERHGSGNNHYYMLAHPWQHAPLIKADAEDAEEEDPEDDAKGCWLEGHRNR
jgi:hypothetical protein